MEVVAPSSGAGGRMPAVCESVGRRPAASGSACTAPAASGGGGVGN